MAAGSALRGLDALNFLRVLAPPAAALMFAWAAVMEGPSLLAWTRGPTAGPLSVVLVVLSGMMAFGLSAFRYCLARSRIFLLQICFHSSPSN